MRIKKFEYVDNYKLRILFSDGKTKLVDLEDKVKRAKGIFSPLKKVDYFKKVSLDECHLSICWPNGADICPDVLYTMGIEEDQIKLKSVKNIPLRKKRKQKI